MIRLTGDKGPWQVLADLPDVVVGWQHLPSGAGWWVPEERVILLDKRLTRVEARCTLAHELIHVLDGHEACHDPRGDRRQERDADDAAARWLIDVRALSDAVLWSRHPSELAFELNVDLRTLKVRLDTLTEEERLILNGRSMVEGVA